MLPPIQTKNDVRKHVSPRSCVPAGAPRQEGQKGRGTEKNDSHFPGCGLDFDLVWRDQFRLELSAPLDGALDALARFV